MLTRDIDRADLLKSSDIAIERRPKAEVTGEAASRDRTLGMQLRRPMRAGQAAARRRPRQARSRAARPERHRHLPGPRHLPHHARQGDRKRRRRRHRQRAQPADQAHAGRRRHRPRPGVSRDQSAPAAASAPAKRDERHRVAASSTWSSQSPAQIAKPSSAIRVSQAPAKSDSHVTFGFRSSLAISARCWRLRAGGGCSSIDRLSQIGEQPPLSAIDNPTTQPGYKPVQMPMPKPEAASYNPNSLWRNGSRAFFKDQRAHQVGDILTVTVNITDKANIANETQRSRTNKEDSGVDRFLRKQDCCRRSARSCCPAASSPPTRPRPATAKAASTARKRCRPTSPAS